MNPITLVAISDTHIPLETHALPKELMAVLENADVIVHTGDFINISVLQMLRELGPPVYAVYGNLDGDALRRELPEMRAEPIAGYEVGMIHGWGPPTRLAERVRRRFGEIDLILYGHSHIPMIDTIDGALVVNPGSTSRNRNDSSRSYAIISLGNEISVEHRHL